LHAMQAL